jgi:hypothetical protein
MARETVHKAFRMGNGMVAVFGFDGNQIPELQGKYTKLLHILITLRSNAGTEWHGFGPLVISNLEVGVEISNEIRRKDCQIEEAISILESGSDYEKGHVTAILRDGLG